MEAVWSLAPHARIRVADRGLREGLLLSKMRGPKKKRRSRGGRGKGKTRTGATDAPKVAE